MNKADSLIHGESGNQYWCKKGKHYVDWEKVDRFCPICGVKIIR